jgi:hypothetical protein
VELSPVTTAAAAMDAITGLKYLFMVEGALSHCHRQQHFSLQPPGLPAVVEHDDMDTQLT